MKLTALHDVHDRLGAKLIDFGGWHMPVQYGPILDEVTTVRTKAGLFDLGHMGRVHVTGKDAVRYVDSLATNFCAKIPTTAIRYSLFCRADGNPIDDILLYKEEGGGVFIVVNASNAAADLAWMREHTQGFDVRVHDQTDELGMIAIQGQVSRDVLQKLVEGYDLGQLGYYKFAFATICGIRNMRVSRTGYTGELGYELYVPQRETERVWNALAEAGKPFGVAPIGLGARDILRLEAGMPLYGHEIDATHNPIEAGLNFGVSFAPEKGDWIGRAALERIKANPTQRLIGLTTDGPRVPRQGTPVFRGAEQVGAVASGGVSPTIHKNIASAHVKLGCDQPGLGLEIDFKGKRQACTVQELPFFSRTRK
ncbi:MAG: glycine cleavage system aminomethyltransferase GcvT [Planctomycetes bacterium]|nr:glycine cleavage system aminomethyltransferase GcvT [Planctomycetota bacterium]